jgi:hypothetical protein
MIQSESSGEQSKDKTRNYNYNVCILVEFHSGYILAQAFNLLCHTLHYDDSSYFTMLPLSTKAANSKIFISAIIFIKGILCKSISKAMNTMMPIITSLKHVNLHIIF